VLMYRLIMALAAPFVLLILALRQPGHVPERLGYAPKPAPGRTLWLHGASNGELVSARWVLEAVLHATPGLQVLVTVNTATARAMVAAWDLPGVTVAFAPLDTGGAAARLLRRWHPSALILIENELWPARIKAAMAAGVPVLVIGARISARSAKRWQIARGLIGQTLARVDWLSAQDAASRDRLLHLGLPAQAAGPVLALKAFGPVQMQPAPFPPVQPRDKTLLAASTHDGEEALILDAYATSPFRLLIIAPRHPRRSTQIAALISARGLRFATRSKGENPGPDTQVYLADTMGEMPHWYAMSGACIIGGSFVNKGGHTPWEPAQHHAAILHGPFVANFAQAFAGLDAQGAAIATTADDLAAALTALDAAQQTALANAALPALRPEGDAQALITQITARITPAPKPPTVR
jgi:3-deoxy-D-manno-octulosonic-acid transferase